MKCLIVLLLSLLGASFVQSTKHASWRGLVPLKSTRTEVERELGELDSKCQCYKTDDELVRVVYSTGRCTGELPGWNVPRDTVLSFTVSLFNKRVAFSEVERQTDLFVKTVDDTFSTHYGDGERGLRYAVSTEGFITSISYSPSVKDNSQRCAGFPLTDGGVTDYYPFDQFAFASFSDIELRLDSFTIQLQELRTYKGYIVLYAPRDKRIGGVATFARRARDYMINKRHTDPDIIVAINGGYRKEALVQLFLLPNAWPRPVPNPTFAGAIK